MGVRVGSPQPLVAAGTHRGLTLLLGPNFPSIFRLVPPDIITPKSANLVQYNSSISWIIVKACHNGWEESRLR